MSNTIIAKQFSAIYDEKEDRLRLIVNINYPDRYDIWITRKFLIDIIDNLQTYLLKLKENTSSTKNNKENNSSNQNLPIYKSNNVPNILQELNITKKENNFILTLKDENKTIQAVLSIEELKKILEIMLSPVKIRWGLGF